MVNRRPHAQQSALPPRKPDRPDFLFSFFAPGALARTACGLAAFALRHPRLFARLLREGIRDRRAFIRLLRLPNDLRTIRRSPLFDRNWYAANHPEIARSGLSPELHYLLHDIPDDWRASSDFSGAIYLELNPEVRAGALNPLVHYEQYGRFIGCPATRAEAAARETPVFPANARETEFDIGDEPSLRGRTAVYAAFSPDGRIPERDLLYLKGLREVCDNMVYVANSPLLPGEEEKLLGLASAAVFRWHGGYDFGSYRIGLHMARERGWLAPDRCHELVFANSSCYGPVRPFSEMFGAMERRRADFWGLTFNTQRSGSPHLQSFFLVFRRPVLDSGALEDFFAERPERATRSEAIDRFEIQLTDHLRRRGFVPDAFVRPLFPRLHEFTPTTRPLDLIRRHKAPLVKTKVFSGETSQPPARVLACVARLNPALAAVIHADAGIRSRTIAVPMAADKAEPGRNEA